MPQAISYTRFSSLPQSKGSSIERQKEMIANWLERHPDYTLSPISADDKGRSGYSGEHLKHGLGSILVAINNKKIKPNDVLLIEALDRLGRLEPYDMLNLITQIINSGVAIITLEDDQEYSQAKTKQHPHLLHVLIGKIQQAHDYSERLSTRIKAAYKAKLTKAKAGEKIRILTPLWLNTDGTQREKEAAAVRACIDLYLKGHGTRSILLNLIANHPSLKTVHPSTLKRWFKNKALIGEWQGAKPFTPLIDNDTYYRLQGEITKRSRNMSPEQKYEISGIVVCEKCSARYYFRRRINKSDVISYANCSTYLKRGEPFCNNNTSLPYEVLLFVFKKSYNDHLLRAASIESENNTSDKIDALKSERNEISDSINNIIKILERLPNQEELLERLEDLNAKKDKINIDIFELESGQAQLPAEFTPHDFAKLLNDELPQSTEILQKREHLLEDPVMLREALKKTGYYIQANGSKITAPDGSKYELIRRSQNHKCYIVRCNYPGSDSAPEIETWAAVSRSAPPLEMANEEELRTELKNKDTSYCADDTTDHAE